MCVKWQQRLTAATLLHLNGVVTEVCPEFVLYV